MGICYIFRRLLHFKRYYICVRNTYLFICFIQVLWLHFIEKMSMMWGSRRNKESDSSTFTTRALPQAYPSFKTRTANRINSSDYTRKHFCFVFPSVCKYKANGRRKIMVLNVYIIAVGNTRGRILFLNGGSGINCKSLSISKAR